MERKYIYPIAGISVAMVAFALLTMSSEESKILSTSEGKIYNMNQTGELTVTGSAIRMVNPDKVSIILTLETEGDTAAEAVSKNAQIMSMVIERLKEIGIDKNDINTNYYNVSPKYEYKRNDRICIEIYPPPPECLEQVIVGYNVVNSINVTVNANTNIGSIIDNAIEAGMNRVDSVYFFVSQELQQKVLDELLQEALNDANNKAEIVAKSLNVSIIGVKNVYTSYPIYYQQSFYDRSFVSASSTQIFPSQQQLSTSVNVTYLIG